MDPFNPGREMPIWLANFALMDFGTGIIRCSAHDVRDYEFATKYKIHMEEVVARTNLKMPINAHDNTGVLLNSGPFTGRLIDEKLIVDIKDWIVEQKIGRKETTYHLRDWIFSRQRYWGEPIPMVHCDTCEKEGSDTNLMIIHGTWGSGEGNWFPWLKNHMNAAGVQAASPTLPDTKLPTYEIRDSFIHENYKEYIRPSSIIVGHSSGVGTALHLAQEHTLDQLILVAPVLYVDEAYKPFLKDAFDAKTADALDVLYNKHAIDWEMVKKNVRKITVIFGENDPYLPKEMKPFAEKIFGKENVHTLTGKAHFSSGTKDTLEQFELLQFIEMRMVHGWTMIEEKTLPLELPYTASYEPTDTGESPLAGIEGFSDAKCPICGGKAVRETDTMPNWAGSCWYFIRFAMEKGNIDANSSSKFENMREEWIATMKHVPPVDWYLGGAEHAVLHLLYARFWVKALKDLGLLNYPEPFLRLRNVGMVLAEDHRKMSKSWGNTINPDDVVAQYGADTLRMYEMFMAPFNMEIAWSTTALQGAHRFLKRVWALYSSKQKAESLKSSPELVNKLNKTIQKVGEDISQTKYNTAIAAMMEFLNSYEAESSKPKAESLNINEAKKFIQILAPFAPFITEKIWRDIFKEKTSVHVSTWPTQTEVDVKETSVEVPVQINGKFRGTVTVPVDADQKTIEKAATSTETLSKYIEGKKYRLIYVKGRICNFVLN
jgi:leucyl-tRNA synthetase